MKIALMSAAFLGSQLVMPVSDRVPELNVEAECKATSATDKAMGLALAQSFADCMRDETTAQKQLNAVWAASSAPVRASCEGEAVAGGIASYVDLLTCIQMTEAANSLSPAPAPRLRGASKNRNAP